MYGTTDETMEEWQEDLNESVSFNSSHISAYCLMIEEGTKFGTLYRRGKLTLPGDEELSEFITYTSEFLQESGYSQYEISNYSKSRF